MKILRSLENAADDEAGVAGIDTLQPDVVIVADGWGGEDCSCADTVKKIKAYHPHIPILVVSPHVENARVQMALAAGANGYLPMGIDIDELVRVLYTVSRGELTLHPSLLPAILQQLEAEPGGKSTASNPDDLTQRETCHLVRPFSRFDRSRDCPADVYQRPYGAISPGPRL